MESQTKYFILINPQHAQVKSYFTKIQPRSLNYVAGWYWKSPVYGMMWRVWCLTDLRSGYVISY